MITDKAKEEARQVARDILARLCPMLIVPVRRNDVNVAADFVLARDERIRTEALKEAARYDIEQLTSAIAFEANILERAKKEYREKKKKYLDRIEYLKKVVSEEIVR